MDEFLSGFMAGNGNENNRDNGMFGGEGLMFLIVIIAMMNGGGGGLFGGRNGGGEALTRSDLCEGFNFQSLENGVRGVQNGLCDGFYAQNTTMLQGFNSIGNGLCNIGHQISDCCCTTNRNIDQSRYEASKNTCDIITAGHADADRIIGFLTNDKIESLRDRAMQSEFRVSQMEQNQYMDAVGNSIVQRVAPPPRPSYTVPAPFPYCNTGCNGVGYGGCGGNGCC